MNFTELQTRVSEETGLDLQNTDDLASVKAWINQTYQYVSGLFSWDWTIANATIQTIPDITTGTATISSYSQSLTLSVAPSALGSNLSVAGQWMVNFPDVSKDWYLVTSHVSGSTSLTLSVPFNSSSNLSAGSYTLRKVFYSLPSNLDKIIDVRQAITSTKLLSMDPRKFDSIVPNPTATGNPIYYFFCGRDIYTLASFGLYPWQISLYPTPVSVINLQLRYYKHITELSSDTDTPLMPVNWHDVLVYGALYLFGHPFIDDDRMASAGARFKEKILEMKAAGKHNADQLPVVQPWDSRTSALRYRRPRLPDNYGNSYGL